LDIGILVLRLAVGLTMTAHSVQKLFGWFGGQGIEGTAGVVGSLGFRPARVHAYLLAVAELTGGLLLTLGLLTPLGAAAIIGVMTAAILAVHAGAGFFNQSGGIEFPLLVAVAAAALAFTGPGDYSIDSSLGLEFGGYTWGFGTVLVGVLSGIAVSFMRRPAGRVGRA
jgi:putative oxidoreductase